MKITEVDKFPLRNTTIVKKSNNRQKAIEAFNYKPPQPKFLEKVLNLYYAKKVIWLYKLSVPYYFVKYQHKQIVKLFRPLNCGLGRTKLISNPREKYKY